MVCVVQKGKNCKDHKKSNSLLCFLKIYPVPKSHIHYQYYNSSNNRLKPPRKSFLTLLQIACVRAFGFLDNLAASNTAVIKGINGKKVIPIGVQAVNRN